jgi:hypothetical protein
VEVAQVGRGEGQTMDLLRVASLLAGGGRQCKLVIWYTIYVVCTSTCYTKFVFGTRIYSSDEFRDSSKWKFGMILSGFGSILSGFGLILSGFGSILSVLD